MTPTAEEMKAMLEEDARVRAFWAEHHDEFLRLYPDQWVAVRDGVVVATDRELDSLFYRLCDMGLSVRDDVEIEFITANHVPLIL